MIPTNIIFNTHINTKARKFFFGLGFIILTLVEKDIFGYLGLEYMYFFRIFRIWIGLSCIVPSFFCWGSPSFQRFWTKKIGEYKQSYGK
jgi:hypothetical protein